MQSIPNAIWRFDMPYWYVQSTKITKDHIWVLKQMHKVGYHSAIIAGGAVRDSYFKKPIKDVDVFYWFFEI